MEVCIRHTTEVEGPLFPCLTSCYLTILHVYHILANNNNNNNDNNIYLKSRIQTSSIDYKKYNDIYN